MTSVEVQTPPPPPSEEGDFSSPVTAGEDGPSSTYEWLASVPVLSSAGNTVFNWYEGSKNYTRASKYALDSVESSVKYVADTAASVVKKPMSAVDSFAVKQLVKLEEKVPAIKMETEDVMETLEEQKTAVCARLSNGKKAITGRLANGKETISTSIHNGKDALAGYIQAGSEAIANTGPGCMVGCGVNRTLQVTENIVDYLLPEEQPKQEQEESVSFDAEREEVKVTSEAKDDSEDEESEGEGEEEEAKAGESRVERVKNLSRKVKLRVYYRTLRRLDTVQQQCKSALELLKLNVDMLKMAHGACDEVDKKYKQLQSSLQGVRQHLSSLCTTQPNLAQVPTTTEEASAEGEGPKLESMSAKEKATLLEGVLDYARQLSGKVFTAMQTVSTAATFLPHHLKNGSTQAVTYSQELYTTLKSAKVPTDIPASVLHKASETIETQLGYVKQLGTYITTSLKAKGRNGSKITTEQKTFSIPDEAQDDSSDSEVGEPPISRPPGEERELLVSDTPEDEGEPPIYSPPGNEGGQVNDTPPSSEDEN